MALSKPKLPVGGLALGPNDLDKPAGDFLVAENCFHRRDGILEPMPGDESLYPGSVSPNTAVRIFADWQPEYSLRVTKADGTSTGRLSYGEDPNADPTNYNAHFRPGETQCVFTDGRHILSGGDYTVVVENTSDTAHDDPRRAGLAQPCGITFYASSGTAGNGLNPVVPAGKTCAYRALIRRRITGDRFIYSAPCSAVSVPVAGSDTIYTLGVFFEKQADGAVDNYVEGDEVMLFRTALYDSVAEINDTYYLAVVHALTAAEITAELVAIRDNTLDANLGEELYTNPGREGALKTHVIPPTTAGVETYNNTTFYINKHSQPNVTATVVGSFGSLPVATTDPTRQQRKNGIGSRTFVGNTALGSPNITNVSADDRLGLAEGQLVFHPNFGVTAIPITAISGGGPYTVTLAGLATGASVGSSGVAHDAFQIIATKDGVNTSSAWSFVSSLDAFQSALRDLVDGGSNAMRGFVVNSAGIATLVTGSVYSDQVALNVSTTHPELWDSFSLVLTNPDNWIETDKASASGTYKHIASVQDTRRNVIWYAKPNQPEHVAPVQFFLCGVGTCYRLLNVQNCMLAFCSDGIFKIDGEGDFWSCLPVDSAARLVHPDCAVANNEVAFAWLESGLAVLSEVGTQNVSRDAIGSQLQDLVKTLYGLTDGPHYIWGPQMAIDRLHNEVWLNVTHQPTNGDLISYECYVYNTQTQKYTTAGSEYSAMCCCPRYLGLMFGDGDGLLLRSTTTETDYKPATAVYLPLVDNVGEVKQWVDANYFFDEVPSAVSGNYEVEALFGGELTSLTNVFVLPADAPTRLFALHTLVPRRVARGPELVFGFRTSIDVDVAHPSGGFYFEFKGATVRLRRASQVNKR